MTTLVQPGAQLFETEGPPNSVEDKGASKVEKALVVVGRKYTDELVNIINKLLSMAIKDPEITELREKYGATVDLNKWKRNKEVILKKIKKDFIENLLLYIPKASPNLPGSSAMKNTVEVVLELKKEFEQEINKSIEEEKKKKKELWMMNSIVRLMGAIKAIGGENVSSFNLDPIPVTEEVKEVAAAGLDALRAEARSIIATEKSDIYNVAKLAQAKQKLEAELSTLDQDNNESGDLSLTTEDEPLGKEDLQWLAWLASAEDIKDQKISELYGSYTEAENNTELLNILQQLKTYCSKNQGICYQKSFKPYVQNQTNKSTTEKLAGKFRKSNVSSTQGKSGPVRNPLFFESEIAQGGGKRKTHKRKTHKRKTHKRKTHKHKIK